MPLPGYQTITLQDADIEILKKNYEENQERFRRMGIITFTAYIRYQLYRAIELDTKDNHQPSTPDD